MFDGFSSQQISTSGAEINLLRGGEGPPLLLLHGYPQSHVMWHKIAPALAQRFTVVVADLRGYGDSSKPLGGPEHINYSKRAMALDQVEVMQALGFERFSVVAHDRGARVAHRLALDHPERVEKLCLLDIAPTKTMYEKTEQFFATAYYHWFFLIQPFDLPERLIGADPDFYLDQKISTWRKTTETEVFTATAIAEYKRCFRDPATIHASCEDYRAAAGIDLKHDEADLDRKIQCPLLVLWGQKGVVEQCYDVRAVWRERAEAVEGRALDCGHFLAEEKPEATLTELLAFL